MRRFAREHPLALAGILSAASLALIFGTAGGVISGALLPRSRSLIAAIPHVNAVLSITAIVVIVAGWRAIRAGNVRRHRSAMLSAFTLFATFLVLYLYRVAIHGPTPFDGPSWLATFVYFPVLVIHIGLAVICVPLLYYVALLGLTTPVSAIPDTRHPRLGRLTAALWIISFGLGLVVYGLLYLR
ncbi:MAG: DUF420 domain-containing protein [Salinirussus sp.]